VLGKSIFIVVDAIGVTKSVKMDSRPLERKRAVPMKDLLFAIALGKNDEDTFSSAAGRLARLNVQLTPQQRERFKQLTGGEALEKVTTNLLNAHNPDVIEQAARQSCRVCRFFAALLLAAKVLHTRFRTADGLR